MGEGSGMYGVGVKAPLQSNFGPERRVARRTLSNSSRGNKITAGRGQEPWHPFASDDNWASARQSGCSLRFDTMTPLRDGGVPLLWESCTPSPPLPSPPFPYGDFHPDGNIRRVT